MATRKQGPRQGQRGSNAGHGPVLPIHKRKSPDLEYGGTRKQMKTLG